MKWEQMKHGNVLLESIIILNQQGIILWASPSIQAITGYLPGEIAGKGICSLICKDSSKKIKKMYQDLHQHPAQINEGLNHFIKKNGEKVPLFVTLNNISGLHETCGMLVHLRLFKFERLLKVENDDLKKLLPPVVIKYIQLISDHYKMHHNTSFYAKKLHIHPNQLNANIKRYLGQTAKATINSMLVKESEYLLHHTTLSVKELAYELGFQSASHFSRFFKRHNGTAPSSYRNKAFKNVAT